MPHLEPVDVLVCSPHPDDEVIGCAGVIQQALVAGKRVRVVFITSGDGYAQAAATLLKKPVSDLTPADMTSLGKTREGEAAAAAKVLGLDAAGLVFLRYPDAGMAALSSEVRARAESDVRRVLEESNPSRVYVTDHADEHADHQVTNELVFKAARDAEYRGDLYTFVVHAGADVHWPARGPLFESTNVDGVEYPVGLNWPPPIRLPLTPRELEMKRTALTAHASQWTLDHKYLGKFAKTEEIFWPHQLAGSGRN